MRVEENMKNQSITGKYTEILRQSAWMGMKYRQTVGYKFQF